MKYAVVDIGTNSARLMIAEVHGEKVESQMKTLRTIRVGEGMTETQSISDGAMQRAAQAIEAFRAAAEEQGAEAFYCFATSAVREAKNKDEFVQYIKKQCGVDVDVISGDDEAALGFLGSVNDRGGMFDIGGGSTEVMTGSINDVQFRNSFDIGTVRCLQMFPAADDADSAAYAGAHALARETFAPVPKADGFDYIGIGGTATALAAIDLSLREYDPAAVQGHTISITRAQELCRMLQSKTKAQRMKIIGLEEKRADVIVFGAIIMLEFMKAAQAEKIVVSDSDNQEGYLIKKLGI